jgi:hypothetical protein
MMRLWGIRMLAVSVLILTNLLLVSPFGQTRGSAEAAGSTGLGQAVTVNAPAGSVVRPQYSSTPPVFTPQEVQALEARAAKAHRSGDIVSATEADRTLAAAQSKPLGPEMSPPSAATAVPNSVGTIAAASDFAIFRNTILPSTGLPTGSTRSNVMEPSTGANGKNVFQTGNWYAARSFNNGVTWGYLNPYTIFNDTTVTNFCCDQVTIYDPSRDVEFWLLQYGNGLKLGVSRGNSLFSSWCYYNITPGTFGQLATTELDYNDIALGSRYIYIASNVFPQAGGNNSAILRMPIDSLVSCGAWSGSYIYRTDSFTFKPVQGASDVMYWASNWTNLARGSSMRIFSWAENSGTYFWYDRSGLPVWSFMYRNTGQNCGSLSGTTVKNWCQFSDSRVLGGALVNGSPSPELYFSFNAKQDGSHVFPYTRIFRFRQSDIAYVGAAEIWANWSAWQFASLSPNARGDLAMNVAWGGQAVGGSAYYPGASVIIQDDYAPSQPWQRSDYVVGGGNTCASGGIYRWGDYLTVRPYYPAAFVWVAAGWAIKGNHCGSVGWFAEAHNVVFGRARDANSYYRWNIH